MGFNLGPDGQTIVSENKANNVLSADDRGAMMRSDYQQVQEDAVQYFEQTPVLGVSPKHADVIQSSQTSQVQEEDPASRNLPISKVKTYASAGRDSYSQHSRKTNEHLSGFADKLNEIQDNLLLLDS